ncbi:MAG: hypothetical protein ACYDA2_05850 [Acidimicrobiales bacterium]
MRAARVAAAVAGLFLGTGALVHPAAAESNPPENIYPNPPFYEDCSATGYDNTARCASATVQAIDNARNQEGIGAMTLPSNWYSLTPPEQLYVVTNLERTARGMPALSAMATELDQASAQAAANGQDPYPPSDFNSPRWGGNWAGGAGNALEDIYFWMYYDGPNSNNVDCQNSGDQGCWIHRRNILIPLACQPCVMGTGFSPTGWQGGPSWDELLADTSGSPSTDYSWSQVTPYLADPSEAGPPPSSASSPPQTAASPNASTNAPSGAGATPGHRMVEADGGVFDFGNDAYYGSLPGLGIRVDDIVGLAETVDSRGYWLVGRDGGVFAFGDARYHGSVPGAGAQVNDVVAMVPAPGGAGYWMVGSDGGIFAFGTAVYHGSVPGLGRSVSDIVGMAATPDGGGYWLVGRAGEVWSFGDASFYGSPEASGDAVGDIVGMAVSPGGVGYWLVGSDGGVFGYGRAPYKGSVPGAGVSVNDVVDMAPSADGNGYWIFGNDGGVFAFGDAPYFGSLPGLNVHVHDIRMGTGT